MRAIFDGNYRLEQLGELVSDLVHNLGENGVEHVSSVNLYFTPSKDGHKVHFFDENGSDVSILRFDALQVSEFVPTHIGVQMEPSGNGSDRVQKKDEVDFFPRAGSEKK